MEVQAGNLAAACGFYDRSLELREALVVANPTNVPDALDVGFSHAGLVQLALLEGHTESGREHLQTALTLLTEMDRHDQVAALARRQQLQTFLLKMQARFDATRKPGG